MHFKDKNLIIEKEYFFDFVGYSEYLEEKYFLGTILYEDGSFPNKNVRKKYYPKLENDRHIAKTPLHAIKYIIQNYTKVNDIVLDPFAGSGTTGFESLSLNRKFIGCEYEYFDQLESLLKTSFDKQNYNIYDGDSSIVLKEVLKYRNDISLVNFSNPYPDGGDFTQKKYKIQEKNKYLKDGNLGLYRSSNNEYWALNEKIQNICCDSLKENGIAVFVIKDMMKNKKPYPLHKLLADLLPDYMKYQGYYLLPHYPPTLFMSTYDKKYKVRCAKEQIILVFKKEVNDAL